jgi:hypothetical protein
VGTADAGGDAGADSASSDASDVGPDDAGCIATGVACDGTMPCCGGLSCTDRGHGRVCGGIPCSAAGGACDSRIPCCGDSTCVMPSPATSGLCEARGCVQSSDACDASHPCCLGMACMDMGAAGSRCVDDPSMCTMVRGPCGTGLPACCAGLTCTSGACVSPCQPSGSACDPTGSTCCAGLTCIPMTAGLGTCG